jgi:hypothetical protein
MGIFHLFFKFSKMDKLLKIIESGEFLGVHMRHEVSDIKELFPYNDADHGVYEAVFYDLFKKEGKYILNMMTCGDVLSENLREIRKETLVDVLEKLLVDGDYLQL